VNEDVQLRPGRPEDIDTIAALHMSELPRSFLALLGRRLLRLLYLRLLHSPAAVVLVASVRGRVVGFVAGAEDTSLVYKDFIRRDGWRAAVAAAPRALRHSRRIAETLSYSRRAAAGGTALPAAELLSLAVAQTVRRRGVGSALIRELQAELDSRGVVGVRVVVAAENAGAIQAYRACGFTDAGLLYVHRGQPSQVLTWP
jgi:ribosomal protein S18 acetylase RimI-like enzyme